MGGEGSKPATRPRASGRDEFEFLRVCARICRRQAMKALRKTMEADEHELIDDLSSDSAPDPMEPAVRALISGIGEDPDREGISKTPARVAKSLRYLTSGYSKDIDKV